MASYRGGLLLVVSVIFVASILLVSADAAIKLSFQSTTLQVSNPCDRQFKDKVNTMVLEDDFSPSGGLALQDYIKGLVADIRFNKAHRIASSTSAERPPCQDLILTLNKDLDIVNKQTKQTDPCIADMCGQEVEVPCGETRTCVQGDIESKAKCEDAGGLSSGDLSSALRLLPDEPITSSVLEGIKPVGGVSSIEPTAVTTKFSGLSAIIAKNPNINLVVSSIWLTKKTGKALQFQGGRVSGVIPYSPQSLVSGASNFLTSNFAGSLLIVVKDGSSPKWEDCSKCTTKTTCGAYGTCKTESDGKSRQYNSCNDGCGRFWEGTQVCIIEKCVPKPKNEWKCHTTACGPGVIETIETCDDGCAGVQTKSLCPKENITEKCKPITVSCGQWSPCKDNKKTRSCTDGCEKWDDEENCIGETPCIPKPKNQWICEVDKPCGPGATEQTERCFDGCSRFVSKSPCPTTPPCDPQKPRIVETIPCDAPIIDAKTLPFGVVQKVQGVIKTKWTDECISWEEKEKCEGCIANCPDCVPVHPRTGPLGTKCGGDPDVPTDMEGNPEDKEPQQGQPKPQGGFSDGPEGQYTPSPTLPPKLPPGSIIEGECEDLVTSLGQEAVQFLIGEIQKADARFLIDDLKIDPKTNPIGACAYLLTLNPNLRFTDPFLLTGPQIRSGGDSCEIAEKPKVLDKSLLSSKLVNDLGIQIPQLESTEDARKRGVDLLFGQFLQQTDPEAAQQTVTEILDNLHNRTDIDEPVRQKTIQLLDKAVQDKTKAKSFSDSLDNALNLFRNNSEADAIKTVEDAVKNRFDLSLDSDVKSAVDSFISTLKDKAFLLNTATDIYQKNKGATNPAAVQGIEADISSKIDSAAVSDKVKDDLKLTLVNTANTKKKSLEILTLSQQLDTMLKSFAQKTTLTDADKQQAKDLIGKIDTLTRQVIGDLIGKTKADAKKKAEEKVTPIVEQKPKPESPTTIVPLTNTSTNTSSQSDQNKATSLVPSIITGKIIGGGGLSITGLATGSTVVNPDHPGPPTMQDYIKNINDNIKRARNNLNLIVGQDCQNNIKALVDAARNQLAWCPVQSLIDELAKLLDALNNAFNNLNNLVGPDGSFTKTNNDIQSAINNYAKKKDQLSGGDPCGTKGLDDFLKDPEKYVQDKQDEIGKLNERASKIDHQNKLLKDQLDAVNKYYNDNYNEFHGGLVDKDGKPVPEITQKVLSVRDQIAAKYREADRPAAALKENAKQLINDIKNKVEAVRADQKLAQETKNLPKIEGLSNTPNLDRLRGDASECQKGLDSITAGSIKNDALNAQNELGHAVGGASSNSQIATNTQLDLNKDAQQQTDKNYAAAGAQAEDNAKNAQDNAKKIADGIDANGDVGDAIDQAMDAFDEVVQGLVNAVNGQIAAIQALEEALNNLLGKIAGADCPKDEKLKKQGQPDCVDCVCPDGTEYKKDKPPLPGSSFDNTLNVALEGLEGAEGKDDINDARDKAKKAVNNHPNIPQDVKDDMISKIDNYADSKIAAEGLTEDIEKLEKLIEEGSYDEAMDQLVKEIAGKYDIIDENIYDKALDIIRNNILNDIAALLQKMKTASTIQEFDELFKQYAELSRTTGVFDRQELDKLDEFVKGARTELGADRINENIKAENIGEAIQELEQLKPWLNEEQVTQAEEKIKALKKGAVAKLMSDYFNNITSLEIKEDQEGKSTREERFKEHTVSVSKTPEFTGIKPQFQLDVGGMFKDGIITEEQRDALLKWGERLWSGEFLYKLQGAGSSLEVLQISEDFMVELRNMADLGIPKEVLDQFANFIITAEIKQREGLIFGETVGEVKPLIERGDFTKALEILDNKLKSAKRDGFSEDLQRTLGSLAETVGSMAATSEAQPELISLTTAGRYDEAISLLEGVLNSVKDPKAKEKIQAEIGRLKDVKEGLKTAEERLGKEKKELDAQIKELEGQIGWTETARDWLPDFAVDQPENIEKLNGLKEKRAEIERKLREARFDKMRVLSTEELKKLASFVASEVGDDRPTALIAISILRERQQIDSELNVFANSWSDTAEAVRSGQIADFDKLVLNHQIRLLEIANSRPFMSGEIEFLGETYNLEQAKELLLASGYYRYGQEGYIEISERPNIALAGGKIIPRASADQNAVIKNRDQLAKLISDYEEAEKRGLVFDNEEDYKSQLKTFEEKNSLKHELELKLEGLKRQDDIALSVFEFSEETRYEATKVRTQSIFGEAAYDDPDSDVTWETAGPNPLHLVSGIFGIWHDAVIGWKSGMNIQTLNEEQDARLFANKVLTKELKKRLSNGMSFEEALNDILSGDEATFQIFDERRAYRNPNTGQIVRKITYTFTQEDLQKYIEDSPTIPLIKKLYSDLEDAGDSEEGQKVAYQKFWLDVARLSRGKQDTGLFSKAGELLTTGTYSEGSAYSGLTNLAFQNAVGIDSYLTKTAKSEYDDFSGTGFFDLADDTWKTVAIWNPEGIIMLGDSITNPFFRVAAGATGTLLEKLGSSTLGSKLGLSFLGKTITTPISVIEATAEFSGLRFASFATKYLGEGVGGFVGKGGKFVINFYAVELGVEETASYAGQVALESVGLGQLSFLTELISESLGGGGGINVQLQSEFNADMKLRYDKLKDINLQIEETKRMLGEAQARAGAVTATAEDFAEAARLAEHMSTLVKAVSDTKIDLLNVLNDYNRQLASLGPEAGLTQSEFGAKQIKINGEIDSVDIASINNDLLLRYTIADIRMKQLMKIMSSNGYSFTFTPSGQVQIVQPANIPPNVQNQMLGLEAAIKNDFAIIAALQVRLQETNKGTLSSPATTETSNLKDTNMEAARLAFRDALYKGAEALGIEVEGAQDVAEQIERRGVEGEIKTALDERNEINGLLADIQKGVNIDTALTRLEEILSKQSVTGKNRLEKLLADTLGVMDGRPIILGKIEIEGASLKQLNKIAERLGNKAIKDFVAGGSGALEGYTIGVRQKELWLVAPAGKTAADVEADIKAAMESARQELGADKEIPIEVKMSAGYTVLEGYDSSTEAAKSKALETALHRATFAAKRFRDTGQLNGKITVDAGSIEIPLSLDDFFINNRNLLDQLDTFSPGDYLKFVQLKNARQLLQSGTITQEQFQRQVDQIFDSHEKWALTTGLFSAEDMQSMGLDASQVASLLETWNIQNNRNFKADVENSKSLGGSLFITDIDNMGINNRQLNALLVRAAIQLKQGKLTVEQIKRLIELDISSIINNPKISQEALVAVDRIKSALDSGVDLVDAVSIEMGILGDVAIKEMDKIFMRSAFELVKLAKDNGVILISPYGKMVFDSQTDIAKFATENYKLGAVGGDERLHRVTEDFEALFNDLKARGLVSGNSVVDYMRAKIADSGISISGGGEKINAVLSVSDILAAANAKESFAKNIIGKNRIVTDKSDVADARQSVAEKLSKAARSSFLEVIETGKESALDELGVLAERLESPAFVEMFSAEQVSEMERYVKVLDSLKKIGGDKAFTEFSKLVMNNGVGLDTALTESKNIEILNAFAELKARGSKIPAYRVSARSKLRTLGLNEQQINKLFEVYDQRVFIHTADTKTAISDSTGRLDEAVLSGRLDIAEHRAAELAVQLGFQFTSGDTLTATIGQEGKQHTINLMETMTDAQVVADMDTLTGPLGDVDPSIITGIQPCESPCTILDPEMKAKVVRRIAQLVPGSSILLGEEDARIYAEEGIELVRLASGVYVTPEVNKELNQILDIKLAQSVLNLAESADLHELDDVAKKISQARAEGEIDTWAEEASIMVALDEMRTRLDNEIYDIQADIDSLPTGQSADDLEAKRAEFERARKEVEDVAADERNAIELEALTTQESVQGLMVVLGIGIDTIRVDLSDKISFRQLVKLTENILNKNGVISKDGLARLQFILANKNIREQELFNFYQNHVDKNKLSYGEWVTRLHNLRNALGFITNSKDLLDKGAVTPDEVLQEAASGDPDIRRIVAGDGSLVPPSTQTSQNAQKRADAERRTKTDVVGTKMSLTIDMSLSEQEIQNLENKIERENGINDPKRNCKGAGGVIAGSSITGFQIAAGTGLGGVGCEWEIPIPSPTRIELPDDFTHPTEYRSRVGEIPGLTERVEKLHREGARFEHDLNARLFILRSYSKDGFETSTIISNEEARAYIELEKLEKIRKVQDPAEARKGYGETILQLYKKYFLSVKCDGVSSCDLLSNEQVSTFTPSLQRLLAIADMLPRDHTIDVFSGVDKISLVSDVKMGWQIDPKRGHVGTFDLNGGKISLRPVSLPKRVFDMVMIHEFGHGVDRLHLDRRGVAKRLAEAYEKLVDQEHNPRSLLSADETQFYRDRSLAEMLEPQERFFFVGGLGDVESYGAMGRILYYLASEDQPNNRNRQSQLEGRRWSPEFFADTYMNYVLFGGQLRGFIQNIKDPDIKAAWQQIYDIFKNDVFRGMEYGKNFETGVKEAVVDAILPDDFTHPTEYRSRVGEIPGLTKRIEEAFRQGAIDVYDDTGQFAGLFYYDEFVKQVIIVQPDTYELEAYFKLVELNGVGRIQNSVESRKVYEDNQNLLKRKLTYQDQSEIGIVCDNAVSCDLLDDQQVSYLAPALKRTFDLLSLLPESLVAGRIENIMLSGLKTVVSGRDNGHRDSYLPSSRSIRLSPARTGGTKKSFDMFLLHEFAHSVEYSDFVRISPSAISKISNAYTQITEGRRARVPRGSETQAERDKLVAKTLAEINRFFFADFGDEYVDRAGVEGRIKYYLVSEDRQLSPGIKKFQKSGELDLSNSRWSEEFFADTFMYYVLYGNQLRGFIQNIKDPDIKAAWQQVYDTFKTDVFGGVEYGKNFETGVKEAAVDAIVPDVHPVIAAVPEIEQFLKSQGLTDAQISDLVSKMPYGEQTETVEVGGVQVSKYSKTDGGLSGGDYMQIYSPQNGVVRILHIDANDHGRRGAKRLSHLIKLMDGISSSSSEDLQSYSQKLGDALKKSISSAPLDYAPWSVYAFLDYNPSTGEMTFANGGERIYHFSQTAGKVKTLNTEGSQFGLITSVKTDKTTLADGDVVVIVSDGVTDAVGKGRGGIKDIIADNAGKSPEEIRQAILDKYNENIGNIPESQRDDISIVVFKSGQPTQSVPVVQPTLVDLAESKVALESNLQKVAEGIRDGRIKDEPSAYMFITNSKISPATIPQVEAEIKKRADILKSEITSKTPSSEYPKLDVGAGWIYFTLSKREFGQDPYSGTVISKIGADTRVYLHFSNMQQANKVMPEFASRLVEAGVRGELKTTGIDQDYGRYDNTVLYTKREDLGKALTILNEMRQKYPLAILKGEPLLARKIGDGISIAQEDGTGDSFNSFMSSILNKAINEISTKGTTDIAEIREIIKKHFQNSYLDIGSPWKATTAQEFDIPVSPRAAEQVVVSQEALVKSLDTKILNIVNILNIPTDEWSSEKTKQIADALYNSDQSILAKGELSPQLQALVDAGTITQEQAGELIKNSPLVFGGLSRQQLENVVLKNAKATTGKIASFSSYLNDVIKNAENGMGAVNKIVGVKTGKSLLDAVEDLKKKRPKGVTSSEVDEISNIANGKLSLADKKDKIAKIIKNSVADSAHGDIHNGYNQYLETNVLEPQDIAKLKSQLNQIADTVGDESVSKKADEIAGKFIDATKLASQTLTSQQAKSIIDAVSQVDINIRQARRVALNVQKHGGSLKSFMDYVQLVDESAYVKDPNIMREIQTISKGAGKDADKIREIGSKLTDYFVQDALKNGKTAADSIPKGVINLPKEFEVIVNTAAGYVKDIDRRLLSPDNSKALDSLMIRLKSVGDANDDQVLPKAG